MAKTEKPETPMTDVYDPWKDMRDVFIERGGKNEPKCLYVSYNGHDFMIPKGKTVQVPAPIARRVAIYKEAMANLMDTMAEVDSNGATEPSNQFRF